MKLTPKRYTVTAALPYANGLKHIGHLAGAYLPADIFVRFLRAQKKDVVFICGSDEHGTAIPLMAIKEKTTSQAIIDHYHPILEQNFKDLNIDFDIYSRTSDQRHHTTAQNFFLDIYNQGLLEEQETEQFYDDQHKVFLSDRYIKGTCPRCTYTEAFGDQCEKCGSSLSPDMLINPLSTLSGLKPSKRKTKHYYLPLNKYEDFLKDWILKIHQADWRSSVLGQCRSWIDSGLQPRAITRDLDWGVPVPNTVKDATGKVLYVWFDAPIGYISATKIWAEKQQKDWQLYWKDDDTSLIHFIGKDNIVFHCIIFPVMLKMNGYILPTNVPANEFMNLEGDKMSTSRGWSVEMEEYITDWVKPDNGGKQMVDALRFYLTNIAPETKDSEFTWKGFQLAINNELVAILGNFINRTFVLMHKLCHGKVPPLSNELKIFLDNIDKLSHSGTESVQAIEEKIDALMLAGVNNADKVVIKGVINTKFEVTTSLENYKFREALTHIMNLARTGNGYMQSKEPWIIAKKMEGLTDSQELKNLQAAIDQCLHLCLQLVANLTVLINPFLPNTANKLLSMMKVRVDILDWKNAGTFKLLSTGYALRAPELLFRKIEDEEINRQLKKLQQKSVSQHPKERATAEKNKSMNDIKISAVKTNEVAVKSEIQFQDFEKIDIRVGVIKKATKVEKADKLLQLEVDLGTEIRTIISGIALHYTPEQVVGQTVCVVVNLAPRMMRGIESRGMVLMTENESGKLLFVQPNEQAKLGSGVH
ncbi:MAG: methionine--tRNA ligase [Phycisphaerales bacterium]|nr:methionine--tRNA ligase [Phycisphaerales bacterium]